jgi:hypothetical protein
MHDDDPHDNEERKLTAYIYTQRFERDVQTVINLLRRLNNIAQQEGETMSLDLSALQKAATDEKDAETAVETLLTTIAGEIASAASDQAAVNAIATQLESNASTLAAATVAGTPAAPGGTGAPAGGASTTISGSDTAGTT